MVFEGRFWVLYEDEPIHIDLTRVYDLKAGVVYDGRTGDVLGAYKTVEAGVDLTFLEKDGDSDLLQFRMSGERAFDAKADTYWINWTSVRHEEYLPKLDTSNETEDQLWEREEYENEHFADFPAFCSAMRDGPEVLELHEANQRARELTH